MEISTKGFESHHRVGLKKMSLLTSNGRFFVILNLCFSVPCRQSQPFPHSFSCRRFQGSASSSDCILKGDSFLYSSLSFIHADNLREIESAFLSQTDNIFCQRVFVSRQGPRWSGLTPNACVMTPVWERTCPSEFRSGGYGWAFAKLFIQNWRAGEISRFISTTYKLSFGLVHFSYILKTSDYRSL